mgnify:CR=1 FL=1
MRYRKLGTTDLSVSVICLGTMTFGEQNSQQDGFDQMDYALERGVNFFDTAELYAVMPRKETYGKTEEILGNWFQEKKNRDKIILASKIASKSDGLEWIREGSENLGFDKKNMNAAIDASLKRLKTDYIDLYQLHWPERSTNFFGRRDYENNEKEGAWNDFESILQALAEQGRLIRLPLNRVGTITKITKAAEKNDSIAIKTFEYTGKILGEALSNFVSFTQPQAIILTGGLVHSGKWIIEPTKKSFEKNLLPFYKGKVKLLISGLEDKDSAILGSAALVWKNI